MRARLPEKSKKIMLKTRWLNVTSRIDQWWSRRQTSTRALPSYLWAAFDNFRRSGTQKAAALAFYAIFSIFPLTLLGAVVISGLVGPVVAQEQILLALDPFLPPTSAQTLEIFQSNVTQALDQSGSFGIIALVSLMWSGLGLFSAITSSLDFIFRVPSSRSLWKERLVAFVMAIVLIILLAASLLTSAGLRLLSTALLERPSIWISIGAIFLPLGLNLVIFALLFRYVPARRVHWDAVWPAAIFGAVGWELAKAAFGWYLLNIANYQFVYGSIATVIVLLFWAYLIASIFLISAELCAQLNEWLLEQHWNTSSERFLEGSASPLPEPAAKPSPSDSA